MTKTLAKTCLSLALLLGSSAVFALSSAVVFQTAPGFLADGETLPSGYASASLSGGGTDGAGSYSYVGSAYASTPSGSLGAATTVSGTGYPFSNDRLVVHAEAEFDDALTFSGSGLVTFRLSVQGSFDSVAGGQMSSFASLSLPGSTSSARTFWRGAGSLMAISTSETVISALPSNYIVWLEGTVGVMADVPVSLSAHLEVFASPPETGTANALFLNTAQLFLFMPPGMSFTSQSGDFLVDVVSPVPEPGIALMLAGGLVAGSLARRRAAAAKRP